MHSGLGSALASVRGGGAGEATERCWMDAPTRDQVWWRASALQASERRVLEHALPGPSWSRGTAVQLLALPLVRAGQARRAPARAWPAGQGGRAAVPHPRGPFSVIIGMRHNP